MAKVVIVHSVYPVYDTLNNDRAVMDRVDFRDDEYNVCDEIVIVPHGEFAPDDRAIWLSNRVEGVTPLTLGPQMSDGTLVKLQGNVPEDTPLGTDVTAMIHARLRPLTEDERQDNQVQSKLDAIGDNHVIVHLIVLGAKVQFIWNPIYSPRLQFVVFDVTREVKQQLEEYITTTQMETIFSTHASHSSCTVHGVWPEQAPHVLYLRQLTVHDGANGSDQLQRCLGFRSLAITRTAPLTVSLRNVFGLRRHLESQHARNPHHVQGLRVVCQQPAVTVSAYRRARAAIGSTAIDASAAELSEQVSAHRLDAGVHQGGGTPDEGTAEAKEPLQLDNP